MHSNLQKGARDDQFLRFHFRCSARSSRYNAGMRGERKTTWGFFWLSLAVAAVFGVIAGPPAEFVVILALVACLSFLLSAWYFGWIARTPYLTVIALIVVTGGMYLLAKKVWPHRYLTDEQRESLATLLDRLPKECGMLVYVPDDSAEAQAFGKDVQAGFQKHGRKANLVHEGVLDTPTGVIVGVHSSFEPCGYAGEMISVGMDALQIPTKFREGFPRTDEGTVIVFVGTKPKYD